MEMALYFLFLKTVDDFLCIIVSPGVDRDCKGCSNCLCWNLLAEKCNFQIGQPAANES